MEIRPVNLSTEQLHMALPERVYGLLESSDNHVFAAIEDNVMLGIAVAGAARDDEFIIHHLSLVSTDDESVLTELIEYIENICSKAGKMKIVCRVCGDENHMSACDRVLSELSYDKSYDGGHHMVYKLKTIKDTLFFSKLEQLKPLMDKVKCYNELDMLLLSQFHEKLKKTRIVADNYSPDLVFAQYYVNDDEIKGFMDFKEIDEGVILLTDSYVHGDEKNKYVAPAMIASAIKVTNSFLSDESILILQTYTKGMHAGIIACFGDPTIEEPIYEYRKEA